MTHIERVLRAFSFKETDRPPVDLMENNVWPSLMEYFQSKYNFHTKEEILKFADSDFRWLYTGPAEKIARIERDAEGKDETGTYSSEIERPLARADSAADVIRLYRPDPEDTLVPDFIAARQQWPDFALILTPFWMPVFSGACDAFGMEEAMVKMCIEEETFKAFAQIQTDYAIEVFRRNVLKDAAKLCLFAWIGDDFCGETGPIIKPGMWRKLVKPYLKTVVYYLRDAGFQVLFHSCGAVREFIPDLIDIGVNALLVIQTSAKGMNIEELAKEFGGKIVFYGGIDAQHLLTLGTPDEVREEVIRNVRAFEKCGGYVIANSHTCMPDIKGENIEAMVTAAKALKH